MSEDQISLKFEKKKMLKVGIEPTTLSTESSYATTEPRIQSLKIRLEEPSSSLDIFNLKPWSIAAERLRREADGSRVKIGQF